MHLFKKSPVEHFNINYRKNQNSFYMYTVLYVQDVGYCYD